MSSAARVLRLLHAGTTKLDTALIRIRLSDQASNRGDGHGRDRSGHSVGVLRGQRGAGVRIRTPEEGLDERASTSSAPCSRGLFVYLVYVAVELKRFDDLQPDRAARGCRGCRCSPTCSELDPPSYAVYGPPWRACYASSPTASPRRLEGGDDLEAVRVRGADLQPARAPGGVRAAAPAGLLPLNPQGLAGGLAPTRRSTPRSSFATNTNWQGYGGETTHELPDADAGPRRCRTSSRPPTGMAVLVALIRGFARRRADDDRQLLGRPGPRARSTSCCRCRSCWRWLLVSQGVVQTFDVQRPRCTLARRAD